MPPYSEALFLAAVATADIHRARWTGFAIGGLHRVAGQPKGGALAVQCVHVAKGADVAELWQNTLGVGVLGD
jgi:hypothetical protein